MEKKQSFLKVHLKDAQMVELYTAYDRLHNSYAINSRHDLLLLAHITAFRDRLRKTISKCARRYTLKMEGPELTAFTQLWERGNQDMSDYLVHIVQLILAEMENTVCQRARVRP